MKDINYTLEQIEKQGLELSLGWISGSCDEEYCRKLWEQWLQRYKQALAKKIRERKYRDFIEDDIMKTLGLEEK